MTLVGLKPTTFELLDTNTQKSNALSIAPQSNCYLVKSDGLKLVAQMTCGWPPGILPENDYHLTPASKC